MSEGGHAAATKKDARRQERKENPLHRVAADRACGQSRETLRRFSRTIGTYIYLYIYVYRERRRGREREGSNESRGESSPLRRRCVRPGDSRNTPPLSFVFSLLSPSHPRNVSLARSLACPLSPSFSPLLLAPTSTHPLRYITSNRRRARVASLDDTPCIFGHGWTGFRMCVARCLLSQRVLVSSEGFSPHATRKYSLSAFFFFFHSLAPFLVLVPRGRRRASSTRYLSHLASLGVCGLRRRADKSSPGDFRANYHANSAGSPPRVRSPSGTPSRIPSCVRHFHRRPCLSFFPSSLS